MPISTTCPSCKAIFRLAEELAGKKVKCQKCQSVFVVPMGEAGTLEPGVRVLEERQNTVVEHSPVKAQAPATRPEDIPVTAQFAEDDRQDEDDRPTPSKSRRSERRPRRDEAPKPRSAWLPIMLVLIGLGLFSCVGVLFIVAAWHFAVDEPPQRPRIGARNRNPGFAKNGFEMNGVRGGFNQLPVRPVNQNPAIEIKLGADGIFRQESELTLQDPPNPDNKRHKHYAIRLEEGKRYQIDLQVPRDPMGRPHFDAYLFLLDDADKIVDQNDDVEEVVNQDSRIIYACPRTGIYKIEATFFDNLDGRELGPFTLTVRELK